MDTVQREKWRDAERQTAVATYSVNRTTLYLSLKMRWRVKGGNKNER
jgi:hypothetical protein